MKRSDFYFSVSLISFILCLGLSNKEITTISGYFYFLENESNLLIQLSVLLLFFTIIFLCIIIFQETKKLLKKT